MKKIVLLTAFLIAVFGNLQAQNKKMMSKEEMQKACEAYAAPGEMHKMLAKNVGDWTEEVTMWMDPTMPPTKNMAKVNIKMVLGGRYQHSKHEGTMDGKPFEGYSVVGYDNAKKMFQSTWVDNMGTGIMFMEGMMDSSGKMIHFKGKMIDPVSGAEVMARHELTFMDDNTHKMEMFVTMPGKPEMKTMEIMMKRVMMKPAEKQIKKY